jgi:hypothetical protein
MPPELQTIERTSSLTAASGWMREFDQTGASGHADWIRLGDAPSLPYNRDAACAQRAVVRVIGDLFSGSTAASMSKPRGLRLADFVLDSACMLPSPEKAKLSDELLSRLRRRLWARLDEEPLEDGVTHSAEGIVQQALSGPAAQRAAFARLVEVEPNPEFASAVLRLAGRVGGSAASNWRGALVRAALGSSSAALREAAVEAIEQWEDAKLLPLLRAHTESVSWLKAYIDDVIDDLSE